MPVTDSPLRYPGGKTQLSGFVIEIMRANNLFYGAYAEPFAGGAGIAWKLLLNNYVSEIFINDIDPSVYAFWSAVLRHTDDLCERIAKTRITIKEWHRQKAVQEQSRPRILDLAFSTFFLNRTNRSGILKAGVIGGLKQDGNYQLDCRFNRAGLIKKIQRIAMYRKQVTLSRLDGQEFLRTLPKKVKGDILVNIDPPYYCKGRELYCSFYEHNDHVRLSKIVRKCKLPWMLTYDDVHEIRDLYKGLPVYQKELTYSAQVKKTGVELLILDPKLNLGTSRSIPKAHRA